MIKKFIQSQLWLIDLIISPITLLGSLALLFVRKAGVFRMPLSKSIFLKVGVFPIRDHFYEPLFDPKHLSSDIGSKRPLPGIDMNVQGQLDLLNKFDYNEELMDIPAKKPKNLSFYYDNKSFGPGDAEYLYNVIRHFKPRKIIEIGCGNSTLMSVKAIEKNSTEDASHVCEMTCIEPYMNDWLEGLDVTVVRKKVEDIDAELFSRLDANDILFIDSSHVIRPQGDVLFEILQILPILKNGVLIHIHDIFSPKDYPEEWLFKMIRFFNEQYLLEAFLSCNPSFEVIGAINFLKHNHFQELSQKCPILKSRPESEPGSYWIRKI